MSKISLKVVYYGPAMSGKTTNLLQLHGQLNPQRKGEVMIMETRDDRTLFFDMLPIGFKREQEIDLRIKLYTVPGQVEHDSTRKAVLSRADGIIFVADSQLSQQENNAISFENLADNLLKVGLDIEKIPLAIQFNKRDLGRIVSEETLEERWLNTPWWPLTLSSALKGQGTAETFEQLLQRLYPAVDREHALSSRHGITHKTFLEHLTQSSDY